MLDRTLAPPAGEIAFEGLPQVNEKILEQGASLFWLNAGDQPVVKVEIVFQSGIWYEQKKAISWLTAKMLAEGTKSKSAKQITEGFEKLGAFLEISPGFDDVSVSIYGLKRNFDQVIGLLNEMVNESTFPEQEFEILKSNRKDQINLNDNKSNLYASKKLREAIYGPVFPYGQALTPEDIEAVCLNDVKEYYQDRLFFKPQIYLCGNLDNSLIRSIEDHLSLPSAVDSVGKKIEFKSVDKSIYVERENSLQSSIRMAWLIPDKSHKDYFDYQIANSLLGGYFGSRLMKNIREEKGYTYGIHAYPVHLKHSSFGLIAADVVASHTLDTFSEIQKEIEKLLNDPIDVEEIDVLTNYMAGSFLASINTPFQLMGKFKKAHEAGLDISYYDRYFSALRTTKENDVKYAIEKYFKLDEAYKTIVGLNH